MAGPNESNVDALLNHDQRWRITWRNAKLNGNYPIRAVKSFFNYHMFVPVARAAMVYVAQKDLNMIFVLLPAPELETSNPKPRGGHALQTGSRWAQAG